MWRVLWKAKGDCNSGLICRYIMQLQHWELVTIYVRHCPEECIRVDFEAEIAVSMSHSLRDGASSSVRNAIMEHLCTH